MKPRTTPKQPKLRRCNDCHRKYPESTMVMLVCLNGPNAPIYICAACDAPEDPGK